jgi:hypothetical protein
MALYNCKCMYGFDKELLTEALASYIREQENIMQQRPELREITGRFSNNEAIERAREVTGFIDKTPTCPGEEPQSNTSFQQCMAEKLRGHEHQGRALHGFARVEAAKAAFIKAAHECASGAQPKPTESELLDEAFKVFGLLKVIGVV